ERNGIQRLEFLVQLADDGDFVAVLQIATDARKINYRHGPVKVSARAMEKLDSMPGEVLLFADATEHQKLGRVESAAAKDHFSALFRDITDARFLSILLPPAA